ncbi:MAG: ArnT family glycosyltransferase [Rubrobacteraceae bacterium]
MPLVILGLATFVYSLYGFEGPLYRDYGIYLYGGQRMADGVPPYVSIFDHKGPLPVMIAGIGAVIAELSNWDDIYAVRLVFFITGCLSVVAVYLLGGSVFRSRVAGLFAALTFLGFYSFARSVASGPDAKTPMVLFEALSLYLASRKSWFWAGFSGSLALLVWQPMGLLAAGVVILAFTQPRDARYRASFRALAGLTVPLVLTVSYYWYEGALDKLADGLFLFNLLYINRGSLPILKPIGPISQLLNWYGIMLVPIVVGLCVILSLYFLRPLKYRYAPILISLPLFALWSLTDFQTPDDFYVFLPYAAIGFGALLAAALRRVETPRLIGVVLAAGLLVAAVANTPVIEGTANQKPSLAAQRESARQIQQKFGRDARLISINAPQVFVFLDQKNPNPYLFTTEGIDRIIAARTPGGFEGWLNELEDYDPEAIAFFAEAQRQLPSAGMTATHKRQLRDWLGPRYHVEKIGVFWLYVKNSPAKKS